MAIFDLSCRKVDYHGLFYDRELLRSYIYSCSKVDCHSLFAYLLVRIINFARQFFLISKIMMDFEMRLL